MPNRRRTVYSDSTMKTHRHRPAILLSLLLIALCSCQQNASDDDPLDISETSVRAVSAIGARWIVDRSVRELVGGRADCRCASPTDVAQGLPPGDSESCVAVCLGARGYLIAQMSETFTNRSGADLLIHEWGSERGGTDEAFSVDISENGHEWIRVAEGVTNDSDASTASIDLGSTHGHFLFVRIVPAGTAMWDEGPEILAIEALHPSVSLTR